MDEQKLLNDQLFSFIEDLITRSENKSYLKDDAKRYLSLLKINKKINGNKSSIRCLYYDGKDGQKCLHLFDPFSDDEINMLDDTDISDFLTKIDENKIKMDENKPKIDENNTKIDITNQKGGDEDSDTESLINYLTESKNKQKGGNKKSVSFDKKLLDVDDNKPITLTKKQKLERKLKAEYAEKIIELGKYLEIKPQRGKKTLSKTYVTKKILDTAKLHDRAFKYLHKNALVKSDTESESN